MKRLELLAFLVFLILTTNLFPQSVRYRDEIFPAYTMTSNITYGTGSKNVLDLYTGTGDTVTNRPLVVFIHGGAFKSGDKDPASGSGGAGYLKYFGYGMAKRGYVVASINYRLAGWTDDATHYKAMLEALQDAKAAIRFFRKNGTLYGVDTSRIYVCGESAGAHTAVQMAYLDSTKVLGFSQWGSIGWSAVGGSFENLALGNGGYSSQVKGCFSNWGALVDTNYMQAGGIPVFCVHGTADATVPYMYGTTDSPFDYGSQLIYNRAQHLGIPSGLALYAGLGHSLNSSATAQTDAYNKSAAWAYTTLLGGSPSTIPTLTVTPTSLSGMTYAVGNGPSPVLTYTLSASNLTPASGYDTVTAAADYEISNTNATTGFSSTTLLVPYTSGGTFATPTIWVRLKAGLSVGAYDTSEVITNVAATEFASVSCAGSVTPAVPTVTATPTSLSGISYVVGNGPSTPATYTLNASYLSPISGNITVTPPTDYEISNTNATTGFSSTPISVAYSNSGGTIPNPTIWVRLKAGLSVGTYSTSETITNVAGTGSANVTCSGSVTAAVVSGDYRSAASGSASTVATWQTYNGSAWVAASTTPTATATVTIQSGHTVQMDAALSWGSLVVAGTFAMGKANSNVNRTLSIAGNVTISAGGILQPNLNTSGTVYNQKHYLSLSGDLTNNGTITGYMNNSFGTVKLNITFTKSGNAFFQGTPQNPTTLQELTVNLGSSASNVLTIAQNITCGSSAASTAGGLLISNGSVAVSSAAIAYGSNATLTYNSINYAQTSTDVELPPAGGPNNLTVNNSNGIILHANRTIPGIINMTSGNIALNGNTLTLGSSTSIPGTLTYTSGYMTGTGSFKRWVAAGTIADTFPTGTALYNRGVAVGGTAGTGGTISVSYSDASTASQPFSPSFTENSQIFINRFDGNWTVSVGDGFTGTGCTLSIKVYGIPGISAIADIDLSGAASPAPGTFAAATGTISVPILNRTGLTETTLASTYYLASTSNSVLPVELNSFSANANGANVELKWNTTTEIKSSGFEVERSSDKLKWTKLGFVQGAGNSNSVKKYSYSDNSISINGKYYYRLKQIDLGGGTKYSGNIECNVIAADKYYLFQNYPNPFNPSTVIKYEVPVSGVVTIKVFNSLGKEVATLVNESKQGGVYDVTFNAGNLASGIYFYRIQSGSFTSIKKITLLK